MKHLFSTIPNYLTMSRIVMIPAFFATSAYHLREASRAAEGLAVDISLGVPVEPTFRIGSQILLVLIVATDFLDGYIARRTNAVTELGSLLDPMADKLFVFATFVLFTYYRQIPFWLAVICISKDVLIVIGWALFAAIEHEVAAKPLILGKWAVALTFGTVIAVVFNFTPWFQRVVFVSTGLVAAACFFQYLLYGFRRNMAPYSGDGPRSSSESD